MARGCGCTGRCDCVIVEGSGATVTGTGRPEDPYIISAGGGGGGGGGGFDAGDVKWTAKASAPAGWLVADGAAVSRTTYSVLFAAIGTRYGVGDGTSTFNLPDFTGRFILGADGSHTQGTTGGAEVQTLSVSQMPVHTHLIDHDHPVTTTTSDTHDHSIFVESTDSGPSPGAGIRVTDVGNVTGGAGVDNTARTGSDTHNHSVDLPTYAGASASSGGGLPVSVMPPYGTALPLIKT